MTIQYPFGAAETIALSATGAQALAISNNLTIVDGVTVPDSNHRTLNATIDANVKAGAVIFVKTKSAATNNMIFGTGFTCPTFANITGAKTKCIMLVYDGTDFKPCAASFQID